MSRMLSGLAVAFLLTAAKDASAAIPIGFAETVVEMARFQAALAQHGVWDYDASVGAIWIPALAEAGPGWMPFSRGRWVLDHDHWSWQSDLRWGDIAEHYGRWIHHDLLGWAWVPGLEWQPAPVAWRAGDGMIAWAPLDEADRPPDDPDAWTIVAATTFAAGQIDGDAPSPSLARRLLPKTAPLGCEPSPLFALGLAPQSCPQPSIAHGTT